MCSHFYNGIWSHLAPDKTSGRLENEVESKWKDLNQAADFMTQCVLLDNVGHIVHPMFVLCPGYKVI